MELTNLQPLDPLALKRLGAVGAEQASAPPSAIRVLTEGLTKGDEESFRTFHREYFDRLYTLLLVICRGREEEAREALQQTLIRVARYARPFDSEEVFWSWLTTLARCSARNAGRKQQRYTALLRRFALSWWEPRIQEASGSEEDRSSVWAFSTRRCSMKARGVDPIEVLNARAK